VYEFSAVAVGHHYLRKGTPNPLVYIHVCRRLPS
jgi:hypothetical protein